LRSKIAVIGIILLLWGFSLALMLKLDSSRVRSDKNSEVLLFKHNFALVMFPSLRELVSDVIYMRTCYLLGTAGFENWKERKFTLDEWGRILENIFTAHKLDRYYFDPYYLEAAYISWKVYRSPSLLKKLNDNLKYGLKYCKDWRIPFFLGFNYFYFLKDRAKGAEYLKIASDMEGAPFYLKLLVSKLYAETGYLDLAIAVLEEELKSTTSKGIKEKISLRLKALKIMRALHLKVLEFKKLYGRCPDSLNELVSYKLIKSIPQDPLGGKFYIIKQSCKVWTTSKLIYNSSKKSSGKLKQE